MRLSKFAGSLIRDTRDDVLDTAKGTLLIVDSDVAARAIGSEVGFVKTFVQGRVVLSGCRRRAAPSSPWRRGSAPRTASRARFRAWTTTATRCSAPTASRSWTRCRTSRPASASSPAATPRVRGFALDRLGDESTISPTGFPNGGNGVIVLNGELRVAVTGRIQGVGFVDAGNVVARASDLDLFDLRTAAGFGVRIRSPVGPIRLDLGFKLDRRELSPGRLERRSIWHISLGQAF